MNWILLFLAGLFALFIGFVLFGIPISFALVFASILSANILFHLDKNRRI